MGTVMARRLMAAGLEVAGYDVGPRRATGWQRSAARAVTSIAEIGTEL